MQEAEYQLSRYGATAFATVRALYSRRRVVHALVVDALGRFRESLERALMTDAKAGLAAWRHEEKPLSRWPRFEEWHEVMPGLGEDEGRAAYAHLVRAQLNATFAPLRALMASAGETRARFEREDWPAARLVSQLGRSPDVVRALAPIAETLMSSLQTRRRDVVAEHLERLPDEPPGPCADAGPSRDDLRESARSFLRGTDEHASELAARHGIVDADGWFSFFRDRARDLFPSRERHRRVASVFAELSVRAELERAARLEAPSEPFRARVLALVPGRDVRISPAGGLDGIAAELELADAVGRALVHAMVHPSLPAAHRFLTHASVARAAGMMTCRVVAHPIFLRSRGLSQREVDEAQRVATPWIVLRARLSAAGVLMDDSHPMSEPEPAEVKHAWIGRALGVAPAHGGGILTSTSRAHERFRAAQAGLGLHLAMREYFDEDWWRNPRSAEVLRARAQRGGASSAEAWADELGAPTAIRAVDEMMS